MAGTKWTDAQLEAIGAEQEDILVSAAAGSGKTAVLVERVIRMITRQENPVDIDRILVMTFTRAAAAQMKTRIFSALKDIIREHPENRTLRQQLMKLQNARICTIDSLCASIVRDHFEEIDLDPGFRIADDAQIRLLKKDTLESLLETEYQKGSPEFLDFVEYYIDKNDRKLEEIILTLYRFAESHPEPEAWLRACADPYMKAGSFYSGQDEAENPEGMDQWMPVFAGIVMDKLEEVRAMAEAGIRIARQNYGPAPYEDVFREICEMIQEMDNQMLDYRKERIREFLSGWKTAPRISTRNGEVDENLKEQASDLRKEIKKRLEDIRDNYLYADLEEMFRDMSACAGIAAMISDLTIRFGRAFSEAKREKQIADFSDIAHYALRILIRYNQDGVIERDVQNRPVYTKTADLMAGSLDEIIVDEYQDTNMLQEYLVQALSTGRFGKPDVFMVGDVKQSIYGFRMACPELFSRKLDLFSPDAHVQGTAGHYIVLDRNFRSRREILDFTNLVFRQSMIREVGGIDYRNGHELVYSGIYDSVETGGRDFIPEILWIGGSGDQARMLEAYTIASRIEKLVQDGYSLSDMVILTRNADNPQLEQILFQRGIPVIKNSGKGFFDSLEIRLTMDLLRIIDNPYQDIPFAAVLYSPVCEASADDLAKIRLAGKKTDSLYECLCSYGADGRLGRFLQNLEAWRQKSAYMGIYELMETVIRESGLEPLFTAMPQGEDRMANLRFLKTTARSFAKNSYSGLFQFIRYVNELRESDIDFGSLTAVDADVQAVRMMTVHKSKGLEFPVVFLACCGRKYNETDLNASIIPDRNLGIGLELRDPDSRMIRKTALMQTIRQKQKISTFAEELRLLYVAVTRAQEKLIITGTDASLDTKIKRWERETALSGSLLAPYQIMQSGSFLSLLGLALHRYKDSTDLFRMEYIQETGIEENRVVEVLKGRSMTETLISQAQMETDLSGMQLLAGPYPFEKAARMQGKIAASQLERKELRREPLPGTERTGELSGAERGNAYHRFLELMDYDTEVEVQLKELQEKGLLSSEYAQAVEPERIRQFLRSAIGERMRNAFHNGLLYRESQFVLGYLTDISSQETVTGSGFRSDYPDEELLLVQGVIDAYFIESRPDGTSSVVLVDYKTDRVTDPEHYSGVYSPQLNAYADVLERRYGQKVTEMFIYSLEMGQEIPVGRE